MIKLSSAGAQALFWKSPVFWHTAKTGTSYGEYTINHNLGQYPDLISLYYGETAGQEASNYAILRDFDNYTGGYSGYQTITHPDVNSTTIRVYNISSVSRYLYFKAFVFGGGHG